MSGALRKLADIFIPLIRAFIASGLITRITNLLNRPDIVGALALIYPILLGLVAFWQHGYRHYEYLVGINAARVFGRSLTMGEVKAGILSGLALAQISLFGEALQPGAAG